MASDKEFFEFVIVESRVDWFISGLLALRLFSLPFLLHEFQASRRDRWFSAASIDD